MEGHAAVVGRVMLCPGLCGRVSIPSLSSG